MLLQQDFLILDRAGIMQSKKRLMVLAIVAVTVAFTLSVLISSPALAADQTGGGANKNLLVVRPLVTLNYSAVPGQEFDVRVNVTVDGTVHIHGYLIGLSFNPAILNCMGLSEGDLFQVGTSNSSIVDNVVGNVSVSANFTSATAFASSNGSLVDLSFRVVGVGETNIHVGYAFLFDPAGNNLQFVSYDGYFNNKVNFDLTMPLTLLAVTCVSMFLNPKIEGKLKDVLEDREFRVRDAVMLVGLMVVMITLVVLVRELSTILMVLFLFSYSLLLFTFGYMLSKNRWYVAIILPIVFILLYAFLRSTSVWTLYLSNIYGLVFALLITLYLAGLFNWKTTAVFGVLLTAMDIILVLVTKTMVQAANAAVSLALPVLVSLPLIPLVSTGSGLLLLSLGLGDFFFAGLLAIQTYKKYGRNVALVSVVGMTISFAIFEAFILTFRIGAFPGTLMIICGWAPVALAQTLMARHVQGRTGSEKVVTS
jgi:hypothetical protein